MLVPRFRFDDSSVRPISVRELEDTFSGNQCAYMLLYRSRALGSLPRPKAVTELGKHVAGVVDAAAATGDPGAEATVSIPEVPKYWQEYMAKQNSSLEGTVSPIVMACR